MSNMIATIFCVFILGVIASATFKHYLQTSNAWAALIYTFWVFTLGIVAGAMLQAVNPGRPWLSLMTVLSIFSLSFVLTYGYDTNE